MDCYLETISAGGMFHARLRAGTVRSRGATVAKRRFDRDTTDAAIQAWAADTASKMEATLVDPSEPPPRGRPRKEEEPRKPAGFTLPDRTRNKLQMLAAGLTGVEGKPVSESDVVVRLVDAAIPEPRSLPEDRPTVVIPVPPGWKAPDGYVLGGLVGDRRYWLLSILGEIQIEVTPNAPAPSKRDLQEAFSRA